MFTHFFHCYIIITLSILCTISGSRIIPNESKKTKVPALYVFGDSLLENGNNNNFVHSVTRANYTPYGIDFPGGEATGRFTNGKTIADLVSDELGLPLSPPYLLANKSDIWLTGYNYASAASGILPESGSILGKLFNMDTQIDFFNETIELVLKKRFKNPVHLSKQLAKSIFLFVTGSNDYLNNYFIIGYPHINMFPGPFADLILEVLSMQMKRLYSLGTRKVMFAEIPPVGCMPFVSASYFDLGLICNGMNNAAVTFFNQRLGNFFDDLRSTLPGFEVTLVKSYDISYDIFQHPSKYGLANSKDACCQTILSLLTCQERGSTCRNHSDHCFWDSFHPTEAFNSVIVSKCKTDKSVCTPMNIEQLANA